MQTLLQNLHHAFRTLTTAPAFAAAAVLLPLGAPQLRVAAQAAARPTVLASAPVVVTADAGEPKTEFSIVTPEYFRASGVRVVRGRMFDAGDRADGPPVVIVNEALARRYWPDENPVGQYITLDVDADDDPVSREVVGVVTNARRADVDADVAPAVYLPLAQSPYPFL